LVLKLIRVLKFIKLYEINSAGIKIESIGIKIN